MAENDISPDIPKRINAAAHPTHGRGEKITRFDPLSAMLYLFIMLKARSLGLFHSFLYFREEALSIGLRSRAHMLACLSMFGTVQYRSHRGVLQPSTSRETIRPSCLPSCLADITTGGRFGKYVRPPLKTPSTQSMHLT